MISIEEARLKMIAAALSWQRDPMAFVQYAFPWGEGELEGLNGPNEFQIVVLQRLHNHCISPDAFSKVFRHAVASGNGIGKSALVAWLILWGMATMADTRGMVTANTETQLRTKTFAELAKWYNLCLFRDWFTLTGTSVLSAQSGHEKSWRYDAIPWSKNNPEAVAGMHNAKKRLLIIFDEASAIPDVIWETIEGAFTDADTQILMLVFGNPTRSNGRFYECFHKRRNRWHTLQVDSRTISTSNKNQLKEWEEDYGEDSDWFRVHVKGQFPSASDMQFIPMSYVEQAVKRPKPHIPYTKTVAIMGVDCARFGDDDSVICVRFAQNAREFEMRRFHSLDGFQLGGKVAEWYNELIKMGVAKVVINVDTGGIGASPVDWLRHNNYPVNAINFGADPVNKQRYKNLRAEMWGRMREWLKESGCIFDDQRLIDDLTGVEYDYTPSNQILLESKKSMKERGLASPDSADALALTFAIQMNEYLDSLPSPARRDRSGQHRTRDPYA